MKKVTIQEAIKANEHSRVRIVGFNWLSTGDLKCLSIFTIEDILADWEIEQKPLEIWCNVTRNGDIASYQTKEEADTYAGLNRIRCVKMREVITDEN